MLVGIGDDCAAVEGRGVALTSLDMVVEGVHFRRGWLSPEEIGWRALAAALSDLAAMGARPGEAYLGLGLPEGFGQERGLALIRGAAELARRCGATIAGGDIVQAPALTVSVTVVGWAGSLAEVVRRDGAEAGQVAAVTGRLGGAAAAVRALERGIAEGIFGESEAFQRLRRPLPQIEAGAALAKAGARALIDLSDGLAEDGLQLAKASGLALEVELARLPLAGGVAELAGALGVDPYELAASGGEDYELLCALPGERVESARRALAELGVSLTPVGRFVGGQPEVRFLRPDRTVVRLRGFEHRF